MTRRGALGLVESPSQLLSAAEWAAVNGGADVAVLLPSDEGGRSQLAALVPVVAGAGIQVTVHDVRGGIGVTAKALPRLRARVNAAAHVLVGDPFSFLVQSLLISSPAPALVLLDDGTATFELADRLRDGGPLVRWHGRGRSRLTGARAARRIAPRPDRPGREVELFTCLPVGPLPAGVTVERHEYQWLRDHAGAPERFVGTDVIGCTLVESGLVREQPYVDDVVSLARRSGARRYWAHRRESTTKLRALESSGLEIVRPDVPLELAALRGPVPTTWITYPSTAAHTLPIVLTGTDSTVVVRPVDESWYTPAATATARMFVNRVTTTAQARHDLPVA